MSVLEVAIWSGAAGAITLVVLICLSDWILLRTMATAQGTAYNLATLAFVLLLSGVAQAIFPAMDPEAAHIAKVLIGPLCVGLGNYWVRAWLSARHRDRLMDICLLGGGALAPVAALVCLLLPLQQQLPASAALVLLNSGMVLWMAVRAWLLGDALALGIAIGGVFMLPAVGGLYAVALGLPGLGPAWQALIALTSVLCISVIGFMLWKRNQHARRTRGFEQVQSQFDPVTKLPGGLPFVQQLLRALERRRLTRRDGAVLAVILFAPEKIVAQTGAAGLNEVYLHLAQRLQKQVGVVNPVGRYWDRCFVALVETIHAPAALRTLGLRVASSLRRPMQVTAADGRNVQVRLDVGIGVVHLDRETAAADDVLHEAQRLAEAARAMASRAAVRDPATGETVPVEHARLGPRRPGRFGPELRHVMPGHRARA
ncbi:diguanylate cyclase [Caenimonas sedimenti]|uniref:Diguanylate cyclase n=1 Tax=Caenimonas sedimenti TaxID=2596921 RepID=A0A562ZYR0_9BURK|nr:diguanylate cyclase [Caenimonas sedimenti]TWO73414.1 diguanylate cyclase [Caenimonas sedimenti]